MCDENIHEAMIVEEHIECPFCNEKLIEIKSKATQCCKTPDLINDKHIDCLVYEMLFIKERNPSLNTQTDSIRAKLFV